MKTRLLVAIPGIALILLAVWLGGWVFAAFALLVGAVALYEFYALVDADRPLRDAGYVTLVAAVVLAQAVQPGERGLLLAVGIALIAGAVAALRQRDREDVTARTAVTLMGGVYIAFPLGVLVLLRDLPDGAGAIVSLLVGVWMFDTFSYFGGKLMGRRKIAPLTSPNKTWEGFVTGLVGGTAGVVVAGLIMGWIAWWQSIVLGLVICLTAYLGDLFESMLKRDAGVKDSGTILMGHGGVLDRFDSLLFASVGAYFTTAWLVF